MMKIIVSFLILWGTVLYVALEHCEHHSSPARIFRSSLSRAVDSGMRFDLLPLYSDGKAGR